ncbi:Na+ dependent nucleoside transporter N-terminal domain-containing protein, partial [Klebsiella pneumoniae]|uniref:Na+ dependent nucleoside transporter N-terminal domain-containing protein n=1 Tax=Klebsiella pneumoniae TaxID=573 RepID=UPI0029DE8E76
MTAFFHFLLALAVILALAWLVSYDRQKIRIRYILQLIIIEIALAFFFLHAESGLWLVKNISGFFASLLGFAAEGTNFVFGGMGNDSNLLIVFYVQIMPDDFVMQL